MFKLKSFGMLVSIVIAISVKSHHTKTMISIDAKTPNDLKFLVNSVFKKSPFYFSNKILQHEEATKIYADLDAVQNAMVTSSHPEFHAEVTQ